MNSQKITKFNLFSFVNESRLINLNNNSPIWFTHIDLCKLEEEIIPDSGQIADYFFTKINFARVKYFLLLVDKKKKETWTGRKNFVFFQELVQIKINTKNNKTKKKIQDKCGSVLKKYLDKESLFKIIKHNSLTPIEAIAINRRVPVIQTNKPFKLDVIKIDKPWGFEIWYTGVEKRGVVNVTDKYGKTELPYSLNIFKKQILENYSEELILLKTLNPSSQEIIGDLYYEMHEKKCEVYVVTDIDESAWPDGVAVIKAGLNPQKIKEYKNKYGKKWKNIFIKNFMDATSEYEIIRQKIDASKKNISQNLLSQESKFRSKATSFVGDFFVKKGDIVSFNAFQIHSLQHGIKVIEFQTPHYERLILMFGQKVLTQDYWDSEEALKKMETKVYKAPKTEILFNKEGVLIERFVNFPHFTADRLFLEPNKIWEYILDKKYHILITVSGQATIFTKSEFSLTIDPEESIFIPISMEEYKIKNTGDEPLICLKAMPK